MVKVKNTENEDISIENGSRKIENKIREKIRSNLSRHPRKGSERAEYIIVDRGSVRIQEKPTSIIYETDTFIGGIAVGKGAHFILAGEGSPYTQSSSLSISSSSSPPHSST